MDRIRLTVRGMHCSRCEETLRESLNALDGIETVRVNAVRETVVYRRIGEGTGPDDVIEVIEALGYQVDTSGRSSGFSVVQTLGILICVAVLAILIGRSGFLTRIPVVATGMSLGLIFLAGLLTSVHCIGMCGGICLSQSLSKASGMGRVKGPGLYNLGRLISYTSVGFLAGGLGSVFSPGIRIQGTIILAAGVFMALFGLKMAGLINIRLRLPGLATGRLGGKGPLLVGILNGFLPCGPLQAVQLYALATGSPWKGAAAMALFCLGTMPLMFSFGTVGNLLSQKSRSRIMQIGAIVILVMAAGMAIRGWRLIGLPELSEFSRPSVIAEESVPAGIPVAEIGEDRVQRVTTNVTSSAYEPFIAQAGIPLEWNLFVAPGELNGCNNAIVVPSLGIKQKLMEGDNLVSFTPDAGILGRIGFSCWMGMIDSSFILVEDLSDLNHKEIPGAEVLASTSNARNDQTGQSDGSERSLTIPETDNLNANDVGIAFETVDKDGSAVQFLTVTISQTGFSPALIALKRDIPAVLNFRGEALNELTYRLFFPEYDSGFELKEATDTVISLMPVDNFSYHTWKGDWSGAAIILDDLSGLEGDDILDIVGLLD